MMNKKLAVINYGDTGSTGKIALMIAKAFIEKGNTSKVFVFNKKTSFDYVQKIQCGKIRDFLNHAISRIDGKDAFHYLETTRKLIEELDKYKPDVIHIHNIHGYYLNLPLLLKYIHDKNIRVIWTLHDFWTLTGRCAVPQECQMYLSTCRPCPHKDNYPYAIFHHESKMLKYKKQSISFLRNITFVTPSDFLRDKAKETYLNKFPIITIHNGIDMNIFSRKESNFYERYGINKNKKILLDVAMPFSKHKGIDYINKMAEILPSDKFQIVLIGSLDGFSVNKNIISIDKVSQQKLVEAYSNADILINPTISDNYPTVDMEAISCGLPVITFDTGGSKEIVTDGCGTIIPDNNIDLFIGEIFKHDKDSIPHNIVQSKRELFDNKLMIEQYLKLIEQ